YFGWRRVGRIAWSECTALERRGGRLCGIEPTAASVGNVCRSSDTYLQDWQRRSSRCTIHAGPIRHAVQSRNCGASNSVEVPRSPQTQADCRGRDAEAFGAVFRCSKNGQTFRSRNSDGLLSHIRGSIACRISVGGGGGGHAPQPEGARGSARAWRPPPPPTRFHACWRCFTQNSSGQSKCWLTVVTVSTVTVDLPRAKRPF